MAFRMHRCWSGWLAILLAFTANNQAYAAYLADIFETTSDCSGSRNAYYSFDGNPTQCGAVTTTYGSTTGDIPFHARFICSGSTLTLVTYNDTICSDVLTTYTFVTSAPQAFSLQAGFCSTTQYLDWDLSSGTRYIRISYGTGETLHNSLYCATVSTVSGDPITYFGDLRIDFKLPIQEPTLLMHTKNLQVFGTAFQGAAEDQWIKSVSVVTRDQFKMANISIKPHLETFDRAALEANIPSMPGYWPDVGTPFETLDVSMYGAQDTMTWWPPEDGYWSHEDVTITFHRRKLHPYWEKYGYPRRECVHIGTIEVDVLVCSTSAQEWFGHSAEAYQQAHLDLDFQHMKRDKSFFKGVLPELWGLAPRTDNTSALIKSETGTRQDVDLATCASVDSKGSTACIADNTTSTANLNVINV